MIERNRPVQTIARLIISFVMTIFLFAFLILLSIRLTLFNEKHMEKIAKKTDYYQKLTTSINKDISGFSLGSNVPKEVLENIVSVQIVENNVNNYFKAIYKPGITYEFSGSDELKKDINNKIMTYADEKQVPIHSKASVEALASKSVEIFKGYVKLPYLVQFGQKLMNYKSVLTSIIFLTGLISGLIAIFLLATLRGYKHRLLRFVSHSFIGAGLMGMVVPSYLLIKDVFHYINIRNQAMYEFLTTYIRSFLWMFIYIGAGLLILGILSAVLSEKQRLKLTH
ncbi:hypothetical protein RyT2_09660 [Pseudolactococcus yaeyamensis]